MSVSLEHLPALRVDFCREADVAPLMRFIGSHWRAGHVLSRDEALLRWQFAPERLHGPPRPGPTVLLAWLDGEIVGLLGLTGFDFAVEARRFPAAWLSQWFTLPAHRRHNVALRLLWAARDAGVGALATLGANAVAGPVLARHGLELLPELSRWVAVFDTAAAVALVRAANPDRSTEDAERLCRAHLVPLGDATPVGGRGSVGWSAAAAAAWDRAWNDRLARRFVGACRDSAYLRWRYVEHPRFSYEICFARAERDGALDGVAVWRVEPVRGGTTRVLRIVEFLTSPAGEAPLVRAIVEAACETGETGVALADFYCSSAHAAAPLARAGFRLQPADGSGATFPSRLQPVEGGHHPMIPLVQLPQECRNDDTLRKMHCNGRLYITSSDGDQDRPN